MRSFFYFVKEAFRNSRKNFGTTFGAVVTIFLSLLVIGVFVVGSIMVDLMLKSVESEISIRIYLSDDADMDDVDALKLQIASMPDVATVRYISKDEAREDFINSGNDPDIIGSLPSNPFPASLAIELVDPERVQDVVNQIFLYDTLLLVIDNPDYPEDDFRYGQGVIEKLFGFANAVRFVCLVLVALLIFVALVFINNTIRLAILARRKEIAIMRLVGASNAFVRGPFVMEGIIQATLGAGFAILVIWLLEKNLLSPATALLPFLKINYDSINIGLVYLLLLGVGLVIGLFGSVWAMRRYLKV